MKLGKNIEIDYYELLLIIICIATVVALICGK